MGECQCGVCKNACETRAGWRIPGDAERIAAFLGISLSYLFKTRLAVDYWLGDDTNNSSVFILAPVVYGATPGELYPYRPYGICTFYKDDLCEVHDVKPFECATMMHGDKPKVTEKRHRSIMESWRSHQEQITALYGKEPYVEEPSMLDALRLIFGGTCYL